jgi:hypothetical protein
MAHDFPVPDDGRLERLIVSVYKRMPEPEFSRLDRIEERLGRALPPVQTRRKVNTIYWWAVLLLTGGLATAAWWASNIYNDNRRIREQQETMIRNDIRQPDYGAGVPGTGQTQEETGVPSASPGREDSPVIYQREQ